MFAMMDDCLPLNIGMMVVCCRWVEMVMDSACELG